MPLYERVTFEFPAEPEKKLYPTQINSFIDSNPPNDAIIPNEDNRKVLTIKNVGQQKAYLGISAQFELVQAIVDIEPDGYYEFPVDGNGGIYVGGVYARTESGDTQLVITQFTNVAPVQ